VITQRIVASQTLRKEKAEKKAEAKEHEGAAGTNDPADQLAATSLSPRGPAVPAAAKAKKQDANCNIACSFLRI
jgi:hypothetical protein